VVTITGNTAELAGDVQLSRASRKLLVDSEWRNQGEYRHSKPQEYSQAGPNTIGAYIQVLSAEFVNQIYLFQDGGL
jgi:hypothetical protein